MKGFARHLVLATTLAVLSAPAAAQERPSAPAAPPPVVSPEVLGRAPHHAAGVRTEGRAVRLDASDIPGVPLRRPADDEKRHRHLGSDARPVPAGAYRYAFVVDGVPTLDPRNPATSEVEPERVEPDLRAGLGRLRYETGAARRGGRGDLLLQLAGHVPPDARLHAAGLRDERPRVSGPLLLHGAGDSDDSWSTAGRAGFILDNLIATKSRRTMIVVMPAGHTRTPAAAGVVSADANAAFAGDFLGSVVPYVEQHYRVAGGRENTAIAGLSMGGGQTLDIAPRCREVRLCGRVQLRPLRRLCDSRARRPTAAWSKGSSDWEKRNAAALADARTRRGCSCSGSRRARTTFWCRPRARR